MVPGQTLCPFQQKNIGSSQVYCFSKDYVTARDWSNNFGISCRGKDFMAVLVLSKQEHLFLEVSASVYRHYSLLSFVWLLNSLSFQVILLYGEVYFLHLTAV